ncbi:MAG TPA: XdhC family protein [Polyangiaceae bacterium]|nr:XdhC family protein [Polyangiaceae bacterium]
MRKGPWLAREHAACVYFEGAREADDDDVRQETQGTGCDGTIDVLVERVRTGQKNDPVAFIDECLATETRGVLVTVFETDDPSVPIGCRLSLAETGALCSSILKPRVSSELALAAQAALEEARPRCRTIAGSGFEALLEVVEPAPHLFVFGSGPDASPVVAFADALGLSVTVCDTTARVSVRERFSGTAELHVGSVSSVLPKIEARRTALAVVMSHHYQTDTEALNMLLSSHAVYIGMLGPEKRTARILRQISRDKSTLSARDRARLRAPIGLDLGAETPPQIALSIAAEIQALLTQTSAEPLSRRSARPIHRSTPGLTLPSAETWARTGST